MKEEEVVGLVNTRPEVVVMMSQKQLEGILVHKPGETSLKSKIFFFEKGLYYGMLHRSDTKKDFTSLA